MKKLNAFTVAVSMIFIMTAASLPEPGKPSVVAIAPQDTLKYKDGTYTGASRDSYTAEPYWGIIKVKIENGAFAGISFMVRDSNLHETFDGSYEKHFEGNQVYIEQCRNDWKGVQSYPERLMESQDIGKVDVVSGATWSYNIFKASLEEALKTAKGD